MRAYIVKPAISLELKGKLRNAAEDELLSVTIQLKDTIDLERVNDQAIKKANITLPEVDLMRVDASSFSEEDNEQHQINLLKISDRIRSEKTIILQGYYQPKNHSFVSKHQIPLDRIGGIGQTIPFIRNIQLTPMEIMQISVDPDVEMIDYTESGEILPGASIEDAKEIVGCNYSVLQGYSGEGIRIGVIEGYRKPRTGGYSMKKILSLILILALVATGCGLQTQTGSTPGAEPSGSAEVQTSAPTTAPSTVAPETKYLKTRSETVWVNWMGKDELLQEQSLNREEGEPMFRVDSMQELEAFYKKWEPYFSFHHGWDEARSFDQNIAQLDATFFEENSLLIGYVWAGSSTPRFGLDQIYVDGGRLTMEVKCLYNPEFGDCAMAGWFIVAEVAKEDLAGVTEYRCIRTSNF